MTTPTQADRAARVKTVLPDDTLVLTHMDGIEALSRPFALRLGLISERPDLTADALLGTRISVSLDTEGRVRQFNGIVARFSIVDAGPVQTGRSLFRYEALVRPALWLLTLGAHCRFFHGRTVLDIVESVLEEYGIDFERACVARYPTLEHCAQYNETDFDFVSRLLERDGIYYYFDHENGMDRLTLADASSAVALDGPIEFARVLVDGLPLRESIYRWRRDEALTPGIAELTAFDFENADASARQQALFVRAATDAGERRLRMARYEMHYDTQGDGRRLAQARIEALQAQRAPVRGASSARAIRPGAAFSLAGHPRADQNGDYLVTQARYRIRSGDYAPHEPVSEGRAASRSEPVFDCAFRAVPRRQTFRPARVTPRPHAGLQTALVVAAPGDRMATERHGRVKVQFHWEQLDPPSESDSETDSGSMRRCWVRVAQGWAGSAWGMSFMPRAGQEVVVAFLDGDPDRPLIVGCVYNSANPPPYSLPEHEAMSGIRTAALSGDGGHNELRFDDKNLQVLLYTAGRADHYVKQSARTWIGEDAHAIVMGKDLVQVGEHDLTIGGGQRVKVGESASLSAGADVRHEAHANYSIKGERVHVKGGASVVIEAAAMLTLKCGGSFITLTPGEVQVSGPLVGLNSGGAAGSAPGGAPDMPSKPEQADDGSLTA